MLLWVLFRFYCWPGGDSELSSGVEKSEINY